MHPCSIKPAQVKKVFLKHHLTENTFYKTTLNTSAINIHALLPAPGWLCYYSHSLQLKEPGIKLRTLGALKKGYFKMLFPFLALL